MRDEEPVPFDPDALGALYDEARAAEDGGDIRRAEELFRRCLALDPADHCGVALRLAAYGLASPERAPPAYVATLFDQHAEAFDDILVRRLGYDVPALARALVGSQREIAPQTRLLDVGCGTGLVGAAFADVAGAIIGLDLSEEMLALADARGVYDDLYVGDAAEFMASWDEAPFDLVVAADVWPYLGDLIPFARSAASCLAPGGLLVASTERAEEGWRVTPTQRFAHSLETIGAVLDAAGFDLLASQPIVVRHEEGAPVEGDLLLARRRV